LKNAIFKTMAIIASCGTPLPENAYNTPSLPPSPSENENTAHIGNNWPESERLYIFN